MDNANTLDEALAPFSKWLAKNFFGEKFGRTLSQKVEDEKGIPKDKFHNILFGSALVVGAIIYFSREK